MPGTACACATHTPTGLCFVWPGCALLQARGVLVSGHHPGIEHTAQILRTCCTVGESSQWPVLAIAAFWGASGRAHSGTCPKPLAPSPLPEARPVPGGGPGPISQVHVAFPPSAAGLEIAGLPARSTSALTVGHWPLGLALLLPAEPDPSRNPTTEVSAVVGSPVAATRPARGVEANQK